MPENPQLENWVPSAVASTLLVLASVFLIRSHIRTWRERRSDPNLDQADVLHYGGQFRRRLQASGILGIIGVLIVAGDLLIPWQRAPGIFTLFWLAILTMAGYLMLLAVLDVFATAAHGRAALARLKAQRRQLERQAAELREKPQAELPID